MTVATMLIRAFERDDIELTGRMEEGRIIVAMSHLEAMKLNDAMLRRGCRAPLIRIRKAFHKPSNCNFIEYQAIVSEVLG